MRERELCSRCGYGRLWKIRRQRYRCARCRYEWRPGPPLRLDLAQWQTLLRKFLQFKPVSLIAREARLHRSRIHRALDIVRARILQAVPSDLPQVKSASEEDAIPSARVDQTAWGLMSRRGQVWARPMARQELSKKLIAQLLRDLKSGRIVCSDLFTLPMRKGGRVQVRHIPDLILRKSNGIFRGSLDGLMGFHGFLERHWRDIVATSRGVAPRVRLAECAWRFNSRFLAIDQRVKRLLRLLNGGAQGASS